MDSGWSVSFGPFLFHARSPSQSLAYFHPSGELERSLCGATCSLIMKWLLFEQAGCKAGQWKCPPDVLAETVPGREIFALQADQGLSSTCAYLQCIKCVEVLAHSCKNKNSWTGGRPGDKKRDTLALTVETVWFSCLGASAFYKQGAPHATRNTEKEGERQPQR